MYRFLLAAPLALLAGCNMGSSTYGTGTTQEAQLVADLSSIVSLTPKKKGPAIDYSKRPSLIKTGSKELPAPMEASTASSSFPVSPEQVRAERKAGDAPLAERPRKTRLTEQDKIDRYWSNYDGPNTKAYQAWLQARRERIAKQASATPKTGQERRYLTEPPVTYRKAYESAPAGDVGDTEQTKEFKKKSKGNLFSKLLGRG